MHEAIRQSSVFSAIGLTTGAKYVWIVIAGAAVNQHGVAPFEFTQTVSDRIVGRGPNMASFSNMLPTSRLTQMELSVSLEHLTSECN